MTAARVLAVSLLLLLSGTRPAAAGGPKPECAWSERFGGADLWRFAGSTALWDDGTGEALYVGGTMITVGGEHVRFIARWNGASWSPLTGPSGTGVNRGVFDLEVYDDGGGSALYASGAFDEAGGVPVEFIARWNGSEWSALPSIPGGGRFIDELEVYDDGSGPVLVAAPIGFDVASERYRIAAWDGSAWSALGSGIGGSDLAILSTAVWDDGNGPALYVGGHFQTAGEAQVGNIARWDGSAWSAVHGPGGGGPDGTVRALAVFDDGTGSALYAAGSFEHVDGHEAHGLARWDGTAWTGLGTPISPFLRPIVHTLTAWDDGSGPALWIGGAFREFGGVLTNGIVRWDGRAFAPPAAGGLNLRAEVTTMTSWDDGTGDALYVAGTFTEAGDTAVGHIARLAGASWSRLASGVGHGMNSTVFEMAVYDDGTGPSVYAAGEFTLAGDAEIFRFARWTGAGWAPVVGAGGIRLDSGDAGAMAVYDDGRGPALYVGGDFLTLGGEPLGSLARWDGVDWSLVDPSHPILRRIGSNSISGRVHSLEVFDDGTGAALYAGGDFSHVGELEVNDVARWDGSSWSGVGGGVEGNVHALRTWNDGTGPALYVGGVFSEVGGHGTRLSLARWNGFSWSVLVEANGFFEPHGSVSALEVFDDGRGSALYAGGPIGIMGTFYRGIVRWDGSDFERLGGPNATGIFGTVQALEVFDDGTGPALYAGGNFFDVNGIAIDDIARWDGTAWTAMPGPGGPGTFGGIGVVALAADPEHDALWVGGDFALASGVPSNYIARWTCGEEEEPGLRVRFVGFF